MITIYLDTSDLSYLVKGRGPQAAGDVAAARVRLERLLQDDQARLLVSFVHLAEIAADDETADRALSWLEGTTSVWCFTTTPDDIFRAELRGQPRVLDVSPISRDQIESLRLPLRSPLPRLGGRLAARGVRQINKAVAVAENFSKRAARPRPGATKQARDAAARQQREVVDRILANDVDDLPVVARALALVLVPLMDRLAAHRGLTLEDARAHTKLPLGYRWLAGTVSPSEWDAAIERAGQVADAPASALRAAIEKWEQRDLNRISRPGLQYDLRHLAYAACCDFATIDGPNFRATQAVRARLSRPTLFQTGRLTEVVEALEVRAGV